MKFLFSTATPDWARDLALLLLRAGPAGLMLFGHGLDKLNNFEAMRTTFADPLGVGSSLALGLAVFAEVVCSGLLVLGLATRLAVLPLIVTMSVAAFIVHESDPLFMGGGAAKEPALLYLIPFVAVLLLGPGRLSLDGSLSRRGSKGE